MKYRDVTLVEAMVRSHTAAPDGDERASTRPPFTIAISREVGALGGSVAAEVGRRLEWPVYDRNILDEVAERLHRPPSHLEGVDERKGSWLGECFTSLIDRDHFVSSAAYFEHLRAAVNGLGTVGRCVIVGRGAGFILPAETTLRVRLVAMPEDRARVAARRLGRMSFEEAAAYLETAERERLAFLEAHFGKGAGDVHHYDLVLNMSRLTVDDAADLVIEALYRFEERAGRSGAETAAVATAAHA